MGTAAPHKHHTCVSSRSHSTAMAKEKAVLFFKSSHTALSITSNTNTLAIAKTGRSQGRGNSLNQWAAF